MKVNKLFFLISLILFYLSLSIGTLYADRQIELSKISPEYTNVDVVIKCEWGLDGIIENAKVYDQTDAERPHLTIIKADGESFDLILIKGIIVNILNHKNHELLKTYIGKYVQQ